jgi:hypothetical protein
LNPYKGRLPNFSSDLAAKRSQSSEWEVRSRADFRNVAFLSNFLSGEGVWLLGVCFVLWG